MLKKEELILKVFDPLSTVNLITSDPLNIFDSIMTITLF